MWKKDAERVRSCFARAMMCSDIFHRVVMLGLSKTRGLVSSFHVEVMFYYINLYYIVLLGREGKFHQPEYSGYTRGWSLFVWILSAPAPGYPT